MHPDTRRKISRRQTGLRTVFVGGLYLALHGPPLPPEFGVRWTAWNVPGLETDAELEAASPIWLDSRRNQPECAGVTPIKATA